MKIRAQTWLALIVGAVGLLFAAILGIWTFASATATPLHPNPQEVPSVTRAAPLPKWADAVEQGRQIVRAGLIEQNLPGLSVALGVGNDIVWAEGFGWADLENRVPVAPEMRFRIGTASTALTSAAVGLLLEQGRLNLDDEIQMYVPAFPKKQWPVTLRQLMGHLAGVRNDGGDEGPLLSARCERPVEGLQPFAERSLLFEPGTQYRYSSYGWILVSAAVEAAAREPFLTFMRKQIYAPLGMDDTRADAATESIPDRATFYFPRFAADPRYGLHLMRQIDYSCYAGSSVFLSPRPTWCASRWRPTAASCCNPPQCNCSRRHSDWRRGRRRVTVLAGTSRPLRWRVRKRAWSATTGSRWAGWSRLS